MLLHSLTWCLLLVTDIALCLNIGKMSHRSHLRLVDWHAHHLEVEQGKPPPCKLESSWPAARVRVLDC